MREDARGILFSRSLCTILALCLPYSTEFFEFSQIAFPILAYPQSSSSFPEFPCNLSFGATIYLLHSFNPSHIKDGQCLTSWLRQRKPQSSQTLQYLKNPALFFIKTFCSNVKSDSKHSAFYHWNIHGKLGKTASLSFISLNNLFLW